MSITDELRKWAQICGIKYDSKLYEIADTIDAAHRAALEKLAAQVDESERSGFDQGFASADDWLAQNEDAMAEHGWVRLPVDADGVPIHVGDVMEWPTTGETFEVVGIGDGTLFYVDGARDFADWTGASTKRHHRAQTVEDVLRQFAREIDADAYSITDAKVAEFAAKLRLAGEDE